MQHREHQGTTPHPRPRKSGAKISAWAVWPELALLTMLLHLETCFLLLQQFNTQELVTDWMGGAGVGVGGE